MSKREPTTHAAPTALNLTTTGSAGGDHRIGGGGTNDHTATPGREEVLSTHGGTTRGKLGKPRQGTRS